jgi:hypothetical protein
LPDAEHAGIMMPKSAARVRIGDNDLLVWPEDAAIDLFHARPQMGAVTFSDAALYLGDLAQSMRQRLRGDAAREPLAGGAFRLAGLSDWDLPAMELACSRALKLVMSMLHTQDVQLVASAAVLVPPGRSLPMRPHGAGRVSVVALIAGEGLYLLHERIRMAPAQPPPQFLPGGMIAHPSTMRPCVEENRSTDPVLLLTWDYESGEA